MDFDSWLKGIREIIQEEDSPLKQRNGRWSVNDKFMQWNELGSRIFDNHLDLIRECAIQVLTEKDPQFELPPEERYAASIHGKVTKYSSDIRKGMAETLALIGAHGDCLINCTQHKPDAIAVLSIRDVFKNADWVLWGSLNELLPTLAEVSPEEFLNAVEDALGKNPSPFDELFAQEGSGFTGRNHMTGLFWALEGLAWNEEYLARISLILGELSTRDPGGNWANRPIESLKTIFLPWLPQTMASVDKRVNVIKILRKDYPQIGWVLIIKLLPNQHQVSSGSYKPVWRKYIPDDWNEKVTGEDYRKQVVAYAELAVDMAKEKHERLIQLVGNLDNLPQPSFDGLLKFLLSDEIINLPEERRQPLWDTLNSFVDKHRRHEGKEWALTPELVNKIDGVAKALAPTTPFYHHQRFFSGRDHEFYEEKGDWQEQRNKLEKKRQQILKEILDQGGIDAVFQLAKTVTSPSDVGGALGFVAEPEIDTVILPALLESEQNNLMQLACSYVWTRHRKHGWGWVDNIDITSWTTLQKSKFLVCLPFKIETWKRSKDWLGESEVEYWNKTRVIPHSVDDDLYLAIDKLIEYGRPHAALECIHRRIREKLPLDKKRAVQALISALDSDEPISSMDVYTVVEIIKTLQGDPNTNQEELFGVEWAYLPLLQDSNNASPMLLENRLASNPKFFCEMIQLIYRSKNEPKPESEPTEKQKAIAKNAWRLLREWKTPPGTNSVGEFSEDKFNEWLAFVKKSCEESGHFEVALLQVGNVLIYTPPDPDGLWINHAVAEALNDKDMEDLREGFRLGVFNARGVHGVDPAGKPEKELAIKWRRQAEKVENAGYTHFAVKLRELAATYDKEAERIISDYGKDGGE